MILRYLYFPFDCKQVNTHVKDRSSSRAERCSLDVGLVDPEPQHTLVDHTGKYCDAVWSRGVADLLVRVDFPMLTNLLFLRTVLWFVTNMKEIPGQKNRCAYFPPKKPLQKS